MAKATFIGAASAAVTFGIGEACGTITNFYIRSSVQAVAHGAFQGGMTAVSGGKFWSGFAAGAISSIASSLYSGGSNTAKVDGKMVNVVNTGFNSIGDNLGDAGMIAFGTVAGGVGAQLTGGNFWQGAASGLVVSGLNHAFHTTDGDDIDPPAKKGQIGKSKVPSMASKLHKMFDSIEEVGGAMEIGGLAAAPFTEGTSLGVTMVGGYFSAIGTAGNILVDGYQYLDSKNSMYLKSAVFRGVKTVATLGMGKAIDRIPGGEYMTDKVILKAQVYVYEKLVTPVLQNKIVVNKK